MDAFNAKANAALFGVLRWLLQTLSIPSPLMWAVGVAVFVVLMITSLRLIKFSNPNYPRWSQAIRHGALPFLTLPGLLGVGAALLGWVAILWLAHDRNVLSQVWVDVALRLKATGVGAFVGLLIGAIFFYALIPGWERPAASVANPDSPVPTIDDYDPERYFRV